MAGNKKVSSMTKAYKKTQLYYHSMMIPGMIFLLVFNYIPMAGLLMAFQDFVPAKGLFGSKFVGLQHFKFMFKLPDFIGVVKNTLFISLGKIILGMLAAIAFAILLNEIRHMLLKKGVQTIVYLPHFLSWVVLASVFKNLFNLDGIVNAWLTNSGMEAIGFFINKDLFPYSIILTDVWKEFGYNSIVYLAAITAIDPGLHEAAAIDGATWFKRIWHITIPGMLPIIMLMTAMNLSNCLSAGFDQVYNLYSAVVYETGDILDTYTYRIGLVSREYSLGTAVGLIRSFIALFMMVTMNKVAQKTTGSSIY